MVNGAGGKTGKFKGKSIRPKEAVVDADFFKGRDLQEMEAAMYAKFSQNEALKTLLEETKDSKLQHFVRGGPVVVFDDLMRVRRRLRREKTD